MRNQKVTVPSQIRHNPGLIRAQAAIPQQVDSGLARRGGLVIIAPEIPEGGRDTFGVPGRRETPRRVEVFGYFPITAGPASLLGIVDGGEDSLILRGRQCQIDNPPGLVHQADILVLSPPIHAERVANVVPPWAELNVVIPLRCSGANAPCRSPVEVELQPCFQGPRIGRVVRVFFRVAFGILRHITLVGKTSRIADLGVIRKRHGLRTRPLEIAGTVPFP